MPPDLSGLVIVVGLGYFDQNSTAIQLAKQMFASSPGNNQPSGLLLVYMALQLLCTLVDSHSICISYMRYAVAVYQHLHTQSRCRACRTLFSHQLIYILHIFSCLSNHSPYPCLLLY